MGPKTLKEEITALNVMPQEQNRKKVEVVVMKLVPILQKVCTYSSSLQSDQSIIISLKYFLALMLRNLDALTTEDSVMSVLNTVIPDLVKSISAVCVGRDPLTSTSRGICYLGTESTIDALAIFGALNGLKNPLTIEGKTGM